jgi:hypothetical protein
MISVMIKERGAGLKKEKEKKKIITTLLKKQIESQ